MSDKKRLLGALAIALCFSLIFGVGLVSGSKTATNPKKILKPISPMNGEDVYPIPKGSIVKHLPDNLTQLYGPDGKLLLTAQDDEAGMVPTPQGFAKATRVYEVPSGSFVHGVSKGITEVYSADGDLILKVVDLTEPETMAQAIPAYNGWIEYTYYYATDQDISYFHADWTCPTEPINNWIDDDVVYLFPSITADGKGAWAGERAIVQPVLEYNQDVSWPGNRSTGRCWVVESQTNYYRSSSVDVSKGDSLEGTMYWSYNVTYDVWGYAIFFTNKSKNTGVSIFTDLVGVANQRLDTALEGYNLETTSDLYGTCNFYNMEFMKIDYEYGGNEYTSIVWRDYVVSGARNYFDGLAVYHWGDDHSRLYTGR